MTGTSSQTNAPRSLLFSRKASRISLIIGGQGVFIFDNQESPLQCGFNVFNSDKSDGLNVVFTTTGLKVKQISNDDGFIDHKNTVGLVTTNGAYYWFSIDSQNRRLIAGIGEARVETATYTYQFDSSGSSGNRTKAFLESLRSIELLPTGTVRPLRLLRDPVTQSVPLLIKDTDDLTMDDIATMGCMPKANLSAMSRQLHECIAGRAFTLDTPDFPNFAAAIQHSITTPGLWCYERLAAKAQEFTKEPNPDETYLRITLAQNNGESPGVPYVMEIWPAGHYSPVHNHGGADAVIRVLHGGIRVSLYPYLSTDAVEPFAVSDFEMGDITWISPTLNQVHQLRNVGAQACITIQCYMYETADKRHYDYFDYIDGDGAKKQFEPDSDMDFVAFKEQMKTEWGAASAAAATVATEIRQQNRPLVSAFPKENAWWWWPHCGRWSCQPSRL